MRRSLARPVGLAAVLAVGLAFPAFVAGSAPTSGQPRPDPPAVLESPSPSVAEGPEQEVPTPSPPRPRPAPEAKPAPEERPAPSPAPRREPGQLANVRIEVTITDQKGSEPPLTKTLSMTVADGDNGMVRSQAEVPFGVGPGEMRSVPLNVDARPLIAEGNKVRLRLSIEYSFVDRSAAERRLPVTEVREVVSVILESGKAMIVAQSADPVTDRRVSIEVKATVLR